MSDKSARTISRGEWLGNSINTGQRKSPKGGNRKVSHAQQPTGSRRHSGMYVALEVSSEPGAHHVGIHVSPDTLLRLAHNITELPLDVPRILGVDDFAFRVAVPTGHYL